MTPRPEAFQAAPAGSAAAPAIAFDTSRRSEKVMEAEVAAAVERQLAVRSPAE